MKIQKKIGLVLLTLTLITGTGIGSSRWLRQYEGMGNYVENDIENREILTQPGDEMSDGMTQSGGTVISDIVTGGEEQLSDLEDYSEAPADNGCPYYIKVNRLQNTVTIYALNDKGYYTVPVKAMICSVGKGDGTPLGTYRTSDKHDWCSLVGGVYGQYAYRINGPIMFHSVPYYSMHKDDLETEEYNKLGEAASLGCVRLSVSDAKWIYDNCPAGTIVTIYDDEYAGPLGKPAAEQLNVRDERSVWDPTDPDAENPWNEGRPRILGAGLREIERGCTYQLACGVLALDGEGNDITKEIITEGSIDVMTIGEYSITYQVQDRRGNTASVKGVIRVIDTISPELQIENDMITLNHAEASDANCMQAILQNMLATDLGQPLDSSCIQIDLSCLEGKTEGRFIIPVQAVDEAGNRSTSQKITIYLDREPPVIHAPEQRVFTAVSDADLEEQLLAAITVEDNYSEVVQVGVSWVKEAGSDMYMLLVTAKDGYGNVSSEFFDNFIISYESGE